MHGRGRSSGLLCFVAIAGTLALLSDWTGFRGRDWAESGMVARQTPVESDADRRGGYVGRLISQAEAFSPSAIDDIATEPSIHTKEVTVQRGDTLMKLLTSNEVDRRDAFEVIAALRPVFDLKRLQVGQEFTLSLNENAGETSDPSLLALSFDIDPARSVQVRLTDEGYKAKIEERALIRQDGFNAGVIDSSLYEAAMAAEMPVDVLMEMIRIFSFDVDFQRDIQQGDSFEVLYERKVDGSGNTVSVGDMLYASMTLSGKQLAFFRHTPSSGVTDYFNRDGQSVRKALLRTPINGAKLTSGFGKRMHPILGYTKMHRGSDFGAPAGTPVMAAGDGVIEFIGGNGAYGNYIRIRHNSTYKTAYAHLSGFASRLSVGSRVKQGQTIGFVGSTGRSTGPHLHYEVLANDVQENPMSVKLPSGEQLAGTDLKRFSATLAGLQQRIRVARDDNTLVAEDN